MKVFIFSTDRPHWGPHWGNGDYSYEACFLKLGVHVPFVTCRDERGGHLKTIGKPKRCDGSCLGYHDVCSMSDWTDKSIENGHSIKSIKKTAISFTDAE